MSDFVADLLLWTSSGLHAVAEWFRTASIWCRDAAIAVLVWARSGRARR
jgi:hypothetical protein